MKNNQEVATLFSGGKFSEVTEQIADNIEWQIYEKKMTVSGKDNVIQFCKGLAEYFRSVTTKFECYGIVANEDKVAIYGRAEFIREGITINVVQSCDVYEFDSDGLILRIHSYCNSKQQEGAGNIV